MNPWTRKMELVVARHRICSLPIGDSDVISSPPPGIQSNTLPPVMAKTFEDELRTIMNKVSSAISSVTFLSSGDGASHRLSSSSVLLVLTLHFYLCASLRRDTRLARRIRRRESGQQRHLSEQKVHMLALRSMAPCQEKECKNDALAGGAVSGTTDELIPRRTFLEFAWNGVCNFIGGPVLYGSRRDMVQVLQKPTKLKS